MRRTRATTGIVAVALAVAAAGVLAAATASAGFAPPAAAQRDAGARRLVLTAAASTLQPAAGTAVTVSARVALRHRA